MKNFSNLKALILFSLSFFVVSNLNIPISLAYNENDINSKISNNKYVEGEVLVKYKDNISLNTTIGKTKTLDFINPDSLIVKENIKENNIYILDIKDKSSVEDKISELKNNPNVEYAQPNYQYYSTSINTNDTYKDFLWGLDNTGQIVNGVTGINGSDISAPEAWSINEGTNSSLPVIVAVIDTGVAYLHPDLINQMWDGSNCKDDNGNYLGGCNHGYDYKDNDKIPLPDIYYHGTILAGIIAAEKNNGIGIIGVAPHSKIMAIKTSLTTADNIKSINFAKQNGAKIINASWGSTNSNDLLLKNAIASFPGLFIAAAGNCGDNNYSDNGCISKNQTFYPASFDLDNIISVAATDQNDNLSSFSNYDSTSIDVGAPGTNIYSTITATDDGSDNIYGYSAGTSMATAYVSGLVALIEGYNPSLASSEVKNVILNSGDSLTSLLNKTVSGKRINVQKTLETISPVKKIAGFSFTGISSVSNIIDESNHTITITVPFGVDVTNLIPTIIIDGSSINPNTNIAQDFTNPIEYTVTANDNSIQIYTVNVIISPSDTDIVSSDKLLLIDSSIQGSNPDLLHVTKPLTLLSSGTLGLNITWTSSDPNIISNDGQTIVRPLFGAENKTVTLTATLTKGLITDSKVFTVTVLANTLDSIAITTPANKLLYKVGNVLDLRGLVVTGTYSDNTTKIETITSANVTGFNSSKPTVNQVLTITIGYKTTTFLVNIVANRTSGGGGGSSSGGGNSSTVASAPVVTTAPITQDEGCEHGNSFSPINGKPCIINTTPVTKSINSGPLKYNLGTAILKNGSKGNAVKELQRFLNNNLKLGLIIDGILGPKTIAIIKKWQKNNGLIPDGLIGPKTKAMINNVI